MTLQIEDLGSRTEKAEKKAAAAKLIVTDVRSAVKDERRVNIFVNGRFECSLDLAQVVELGVKVGQKVDAERLLELKRESEFGKIYQRALEWALVRPRSARELQDYLKRRQMKRRQLNWQREKDGKKALMEIDERTIQLVANRLIERGYIDDQKFADYMIESKQGRKGVSERKLRLELKRKGVSQDNIERALNDQSYDEREELRRVIRKKRRRYDAPKLINYLVRQGFDFEEVREAVAEEYDERI